MANPKSKQRRKILVFSAIAVVLAGLTAFAALRKHEPEIAVETDKVTRRDITETVVANGRIQPVVQVKISAEVSGEIIELPFKEGQAVKKGDLLVRIKPDVYQANKRSSQSSFDSALSGIALAEANKRKADLECKRNDALYAAKLISESQMLEYKTALDIAQAQLDSSRHQLAVTKASLDRAEEELAKTTIYSPIDGTVSKQSLEVGERVAGNTMMAGTEILTVAELKDMEARVDIGEIDIVLIAKGQTAELEVDAFRDRKFKGTVTEIANSSKGAGVATSSADATKFEVKIRIDEKENFRPGMSVTAEIRTRSQTNTLSVPVQAVTTRMPQAPTNTTASAGGATNAPPKPATNTVVTGKNSETNKPIEVVFVVDNDRVKMVPVKRGINDDTAAEILGGLSEGQEIVCGGYRAVSRELANGKKIHKQKPAEGKGDKKGAE